MPIENPFMSAHAAQQYAKGRPYFHPVIIESIRGRLGLHEPVAVGVDVACGTGLSTLALCALAQRVIGVDASAEMVAQAPKDARIEYLMAPAENLPLGDGTADLMTVALAFHWLDRGAFLREALRVLKPGGWLVLYDHSFQARMVEDPAFATHMGALYRETFPSPPRDKTLLTEEQAMAHGLRLAGTQQYANSLTFTLPQLVDYLLSQSTFTTPVDSGQATEPALRAWLTERLSPSFANRAVGTFTFAVEITDVERPEAGG